MKMFSKILLFLIVLLSSNLTIEKIYAKTTFKGGIITQSQNLETKKPKIRED